MLDNHLVRRTSSVADPRRRPSDGAENSTLKEGGTFLSFAEALVREAKPKLLVELVWLVRVSVPEEIDDVADAVQELAALCLVERRHHSRAGPVDDLSSCDKLSLRRP